MNRIDITPGCGCPVCTVRMSEAGFRAIAAIADSVLNGQAVTIDALKAIVVVARTAGAICATVLANHSQPRGDVLVQ